MMLILIITIPLVASVASLLVRKRTEVLNIVAGSAAVLQLAVCALVIMSVVKKRGEDRDR